MGSNQVKTAPSPLLQVESRAFSCQDERERRIRKGIPRRLKSMLLSDWIQMKKREGEVLQKARQAVQDGRAPREILERVEKHVNRDSKCHIRYHPRILPRRSKPRPRLRAPRLTNTAARRIQESYHRREREQQQREKKVEEEEEATKTLQARASLKSQVSTPSTKGPRRRTKRASSLPPTSTLSLQSITTADSSGIGMSRTSSMTSVASARHSKPYYTRQRVGSLERDGKSRSRSVESRAQGETTRRRKCQASTLRDSRREQTSRRKSRSPQGSQQAQQEADEQSRRVSSGDNRQKPQDTNQELLEGGKKPQSAKDKQQIEEREHKLSETPGGKELSSEHQKQEREVQRNKQTEKRDQSSQTRLSGTHRPRRLLLTKHSCRSLVSPDKDSTLRTQSGRRSRPQRQHPDGSSSEQKEEQSSMKQEQKTKTILVKTLESQELKTHVQEGRQRTPPVLSPREPSVEKAADGGRQEQLVTQTGRRADQTRESYAKEEVKEHASRHQVQVRHGPLEDDDLLPQQASGAKLLDLRRQEEHTASRQTQTSALPKDHQQPSQEQLTETGRHRWRGLLRHIRETKSKEEPQVQGRSRSLVRVTSVQSQTEDVPGNASLNLERPGELRRPPNQQEGEAQAVRLPVGSVEHCATVESQGGGRPGRLSQRGVQSQGRRQMTSLDRWHANALLTKRRNREEGRSRSVERKSPERGRRQQQQQQQQPTTESVHELTFYEGPNERARSTREPSVDSVERTRHELLRAADATSERAYNDPSLTHGRSPFYEYSRRESSAEREPFAPHSERRGGYDRMTTTPPDRLRTYQDGVYAAERRYYNAELAEPVYTRSYHERRYVGPLEHTLPTTTATRYARAYSDHTYNRSYSEHRERSVEADYSRLASERLPDAWKSVEDARHRRALVEPRSDSAHNRAL